MTARLLTVSFLILSIAQTSRLSAAEPVPPLPPATDVASCWSGYWISCTSGHKGPLQAKICRISDDCYRANFSGRFFGVIPFRYSVNLQVTGRDGDKVFLSGSSFLGLAFGTFSYSAVVTPCEFVADYCSRSDRGRFVMSRVGN